MATDDRYDRQLRLWGPHGQRALMEARICALGSTAIATETLKNLVLPGIGHFAVVDDAFVHSADLGQNFFLEESDLGRLRSQAVCGRLQELNPDVTGEFVNMSPVEAVMKGSEFFRGFTIVLACQLTERVCGALCRICQGLGIPTLFPTSLGFVGKIRAYAPEHCVVESKPEAQFGDLRLLDPFAELRALSDAISYESLDDAQHSHIPYVLLLIRANDIFKKEFPGRCWPESKEERDFFKSAILSMRRSENETNFQEALDNSWRACRPNSLPEGARKVLEEASPKSPSDFWICSCALRAFYDKSANLPVPGTLPDMYSSTDMYVALQEVYKARADRDLAEIQAMVEALRKQRGRADPVPPGYIKLFCQNAQFLQVFRYRTLDEEFSSREAVEGVVDIVEESSDNESLVPWYLALRAADRFREERGRWPGADCDDGEANLSSDLAQLSQVASAVIESQSAKGLTLEPRFLEEIVRCGGAEIHTTSSFLGGVASQEIVKLITKQCTPICNTLLYDGLHCRAQCLTF